MCRVPTDPRSDLALHARLTAAGFFAPMPMSIAPEVGPPVFRSLTLLLTRACNLACRYCYASARPGGPAMPRALATDAVDTYLDQLPGTIARITFHGGEPTLEADTIRSVVDRVTSARPGVPHRYLITTNGTCDPSFLDWMVAEQFGISISIDGPPDVQDRNRPFADGSPSSPVVRATIERLVAQQAPFTVRMTYTATDDIDRTIGYFADLGVRSIHLEPLFPYGREFDDPSTGPLPLAAPRGEDLVPAFVRALDLCRARGLRVVNSHFANFSRPAGYFCGSICGRAMFVTHDGLLTGCLEVVDGADPLAPTFTLGRWRPTTHDFELDPVALDRLRGRHADTLDPCRSCFARYHCAGGCAVKAVRGQGSLDERDRPYCAFTKAFVPILTERIAADHGL